MIDHVPSQIRKHPCSCVYTSRPGACQVFCGESLGPDRAARRASRTPELDILVGPGFHPKQTSLAEPRTLHR